jgi:hypothetical protein
MYYDENGDCFCWVVKTENIIMEYDKNGNLIKQKDLTSR